MPHWPRANAASPHVSPREGTYVLVAMPNVQRAAFYRSVASEFGVDVAVVRDGQEARGCLTERGAPALLITDLSLPKIDAFALLKYLRHDVQPDGTGVIVVSAYDQLRSAAQAMTESLGIGRILPADADRAAIVEAVRSCMRTAPPMPAQEAATSDAPSHARPGLTVQEILGAAAVEVTRRFPAPVCLAYLRVGDQERFAAYLSGGHTPPVGPHSEEWLLVRQLAATCEPLVLADVKTHPLLSESLGVRSTAFRGFAGIPLFCDHAGVSGALCLADTEPSSLGAADLDGLSAFASDLERQLESAFGSMRQTAVPITTTIDVETLERLAVTDPLTGLANRRGGERSVASEISRARRQRTPLSCIFIDIDHFKQINDTFGHQAGDRLLRDVSELLRRTMRAYDILIRWGGEEFLLILPGVNLEQARRLADRIRSAVERLETQGLGVVTISAGTAALDGSYDFETMLMAADRRLYQAKASGRNAVV
jgi:diguanylate cyclase (GGDEF)-like protein